MKQISSDFTPLLKSIIPWTIIILLISGTIVAFIGGQFSLAFGVIVIGTVVIGFMRTMLMGLKKVYLDRENKLIVVKGTTEESIPYADIKEILRPWTPPYIATVKLTKSYSFGNDFTFIPEGHPIEWGNYDADLQQKIRK
jgi:hypothetical protein